MTNMKLQNKVRHGDLVIKQIDEIPQDVKLRKGLIVLLGEVTGHKHQLTSGKIFDGKDGLIYLNLAKNSSIIHEEHNTIKLARGKYVVLRTREYDYSSKKIKEVTD